MKTILTFLTSIFALAAFAQGPILRTPYTVNTAPVVTNIIIGIVTNNAIAKTNGFGYGTSLQNATNNGTTRFGGNAKGIIDIYDTDDSQYYRLEAQSGGLTVGAADFTAGQFFGSASASSLTSGTIPDARFPAILPAVDGSQLTGIAAGSQTPWTSTINAANNSLTNAGQITITNKPLKITYRRPPGQATHTLEHLKLDVGNPTNATYWTFRNHSYPNIFTDTNRWGYSQFWGYNQSADSDYNTNEPSFTMAAEMDYWTSQNINQDELWWSWNPGGNGYTNYGRFWSFNLNRDIPTNWVGNVEHNWIFDNFHWPMFDGGFSLLDMTRESDKSGITMIFPYSSRINFVGNTNQPGYWVGDETGARLLGKYGGVQAIGAQRVFPSTTTYGLWFGPGVDGGSVDQLFAFGGGATEGNALVFKWDATAHRPMWVNNWQYVTNCSFDYFDGGRFLREPLYVVPNVGSSNVFANLPVVLKDANLRLETGFFASFGNNDGGGAWPRFFIGDANGQFDMQYGTDRDHHWKVGSTALGNGTRIMTINSAGVFAGAITATNSFTLNGVTITEWPTGGASGPFTNTVIGYGDAQRTNAISIQPDAVTISNSSGGLTITRNALGSGGVQLNSTGGPLFLNAPSGQSVFTEINGSIQTEAAAGSFRPWADGTTTLGIVGQRWGVAEILRVNSSEVWATNGFGGRSNIVFHVPTNAPTDGQVVTAAGTLGHTKWAASAGGSGGTNMFYVTPFDAQHRVLFGDTPNFMIAWDAGSNVVYRVDSSGNVETAGNLTAAGTMQSAGGQFTALGGSGDKVIGVDNDGNVQHMNTASFSTLNVENAYLTNVYVGNFYTPTNQLASTQIDISKASQSYRTNNNIVLTGLLGVDLSNTNSQWSRIVITNSAGSGTPISCTLNGGFFDLNGAGNPFWITNKGMLYVQRSAWDGTNYTWEGR